MLNEKIITINSVSGDIIFNQCMAYVTDIASKTAIIANVMLSLKG